MRRFTSILVAIIFSVLNSHAWAIVPDVARWDDYDPQKLLSVVNGTIELATGDGPRVLRWHVNAGQNSTLSIRPDQPLFDQLRYYDRLQFDFRIVTGDIDLLELRALGHVSGPRQYKVHQWDLGQITTTHGDWHFREVDLNRPNWFPWDDPDGQPEHGFFSLGALAVSPNTVIELRNVRLVRGLIRLKPFYELPITWPIKSENPDGSITYAMHFVVLNSSNRPTDVSARLESQHSKFKISFDHEKINVKDAASAEFVLSATMSKADIDATPELYEEPLRVLFSPAQQPDATTVFESVLVRPLSKEIRRQVVVPTSDLDLIHQKLAAGDQKMRELVNYDGALSGADDFCKIRLDHIPGGHGGVANDWPRAPGTDHRLQHGSFMPEVVDPQSGFREAGTDLANAWWKEYLGYSGQVPAQLGMAYLLSGDEKYAAKGIELMSLYAQQYAKLPWGNPIYDPPFDPGPAILCSSRAAACSTYGSNWNFKWICKMLGMIGDSKSLTPDKRAAIYQGFVLPYATELSKFTGRIDNMTDISNHNLLLLGLVFDDAHLVRAATRTDPGLISRLSDISDDGFSSEGRPLNYHLAAMTEYVPALTYLANSGLKLDYPKQKMLAALRMSYQRANLTGYVPITGDNGRGWTVGPTALADDLIQIFPDEQWLYDVGEDSTLSKKVRLFAGEHKANQPWQKLLETTPRLFKDAGFAILRTGDTPQTQIMLTLDFGRNPFHSALDRNQITLFAFGKTMTQGPGALYNAGSNGGRGDTNLQSFCSHGSLGHNVIMVDAMDQQPAIGRLLAWNPTADRQSVVSRVDGVRPGVDHTRGVMLTHGIIVMIDHIESDQTHVYDFVYHNLGVLHMNSTATSTRLDQPLATTANYEHIENCAKLDSVTMAQAEWDVEDVHLSFWQPKVSDGEFFTGVTGMNDNQPDIPRPAPTIIQRVHAKAEDFFTVIEPHRGDSQVRSVEHQADLLKIVLRDGQTIDVSLATMIASSTISTTQPAN